MLEHTEIYQEKLRDKLDKLKNLPDLPDEIRKQFSQLPDDLTPCKKFSPKVPDAFAVRTESVLEKRVSARMGRYQEITTVIRNGAITDLPTISADMINNAPEDWLVYAKAIVDAMTEGRIINKMDPADPNI